MNHQSHKSEGEVYVFFDGFCNLCNFFIRWLMKRSQGDLVFASLQGDTAKKLGLGDAQVKSVLTYCPKTGLIKSESDAVLHIFKRLGRPWSFLFFFAILPRGFRDLIYRFIASNRYRWFGKRDECSIPEPDPKK